MSGFNVQESHTVDWNLFATKFFCEYSKSENNTIAKNFNDYIVFIVVMNFRKNFSSRFPGISANTFKRKIVPVYSILSRNDPVQGDNPVTVIKSELDGRTD